MKKFFLTPMGMIQICSSIFAPLTCTENLVHLEDTDSAFESFNCVGSISKFNIIFGLRKDLGLLLCHCELIKFIGTFEY